MTAIVWQQRALALAGVLQAVHLVACIARTGTVSQDSMEQSLRSIFVVNPASISDVFAGTAGVATGLGLAADLLGRFDPRAHADLVRLGLSVVKLERRLAGLPVLGRELGERIAAIDARRNGTAAVDDDTVASLGELYRETLSRIPPRIKVSGKRNYLQNATNTGRIRALLLAAVRAAVLWHQVGGRRWQLFLARRRMTQALQFIG